MRKRILQKLSQGKFVSGQQIADELKISRTAVFKHIKALEKIGYVIESSPKQGYRLLKVSTKIHPLVVNDCLKTKFIAHPLIHFDQVASTINQAMIRSGKNEGLTVVAEKQIKSRGRFGRAWSAPQGGIWTSILLKPKNPPNEAARLNIIASLAIAESIEQSCGVQAQIKWPNDVIIENRKVAGILTDLVAEVDKINYAIMSFGINVNNKIASSISDVAISIKEVTGTEVDRVKLFCLILKKIETFYLQWQNQKFELILDEWKKRCLTLGKEIQVKGLNRVLEGKAVDLDENGALILKTKAGQRHTLSAGEVTILKGK